MRALANQHGAIGIALAALLPLLLATVATSTAIFFTLRTHSGLLHECRTTLLKTENDRLARLHALIRLNPSAQRLRAARTKADAALKAAQTTGVPHLIATAKATQSAVIARQITFRARQLRLLTRSRTETQLALTRLQARLPNRLRNEAHLMDRSDANGSPLLSKPSLEWRPLAVQATPSDSLTPDYKPHPNFENAQTMRVSWTFFPTRLLPAWLGLTTFTSLPLHASCATTAEPKGKSTWRARLQADKPRSI